MLRAGGGPRRRVDLCWRNPQALVYGIMDFTLGSMGGQRIASVHATGKSGADLAVIQSPRSVSIRS
jgi:hypothetical protein